ncbi:hypothetical protein BDP27DRAFT_1454470 [Rhodocollybia butyracea]|uniref:Uncharacterized protein n=1 Tax=Rhodocollybia butyracea TaxID=206335 RepID=A0A9P5TWR8_9AGAR|nr:hypothetical protein BDP27DRAFT_1454470 [Rhodocollybia butyracea]
MYKFFSAVFALLLVQTLATGGVSATCTSNDDVIMAKSVARTSLKVLGVLSDASLRCHLVTEWVHGALRESVSSEREPLDVKFSAKPPPSADP